MRPYDCTSYVALERARVRGVEVAGCAGRGRSAAAVVSGPLRSKCPSPVEAAPPRSAGSRCAGTPSGSCRARPPRRRERPAGSARRPAPRPARASRRGARPSDEQSMPRPPASRARCIASASRCRACSRSSWRISAGVSVSPRGGRPRASPRARPLRAARPGAPPVRPRAPTVAPDEKPSATAKARRRTARRLGVEALTRDLEAVAQRDLAHVRQPGVLRLRDAREVEAQALPLDAEP